MKLIIQANWQKIHLKSLESAYRLSAFYEYYADDISRFYEHKTPLLFEWNMQLLKTMLHLLGILQEPAETEFWECGPVNGQDYRQTINPKNRLSKPDNSFHPVPYQQAFIERYGFLPNLSIVDLLFNEGPEALSILKNLQLETL